MRKLERQQQSSHTFSNSGIEKQANFIKVVGDWVEDSLKVKLESEFGSVTEDLKRVIQIGESFLADRFYLLRIADKFGWSAVSEFTATELARTEEEEKKLKKIIKANESKLERQREMKKDKTRVGYYNQGRKTGYYNQGSSDGSGN